MTKPHSALNQLTPELLLRAYASGIFPMSEARDDPNIFWVDPRLRAVLPLDAFHVSRSLAKTVRKKIFQISCDTAFADVINACAASTQERQETWINDEIINAYTELHHMGFAHSVECRRDGALVGGLYGVSIGAAFCGESMFHTAANASKVALVHLVARLKLGGYVLLDTQFVTDHLKQFGIIEIPARKYLTRLDKALEIEAAFPVEVAPQEEE
ncbi:MAG TPA: leucyl/phenylalanyl-tRNA--protein transferase, partial [Rhodospirillales bacterium]|nr:leucyl/phenylalanyl-tRNA--protein transferase [Rhodospirillales bacterium]